jgi:hypothetical protein
LLQKSYRKFTILVREYCWCRIDLPPLIHVAISSILDNQYVAHSEQGQDNINIHSCIIDVIDIDLGGATLRRIVPQQIEVAWISRSA